MAWEHYFWGTDEGYQYRRFTNSRVSHQNLQFYRYVAIVTLAPWLLAGFVLDQPFGQFAYLTTWAAYFAFASLILNAIATEDQVENPGKVEGMQFWRWRTAIWFFEFSLSFNLMSTLAYWTFLYDHQPHRELNHYYNIFVHTLPVVFSLAEFYMTRW